MSANRMFYVIYSPDCDLYMNDEGSLGSYEGAAQFQFGDDALRGLTDGLKTVGPCIEGEQP